MTKAKSKRKPAPRTNDSTTKIRNSVKRMTARKVGQLKSVTEPAAHQRPRAASQPSTASASTAGRAYPLRADVHLLDRTARPAVVPAVSDAAMSAPSRHSAARSASSDDDASVSARGAFFGRRKGHRLRSHQADLIEHLLPRLAPDIIAPALSDLAALFDPQADEVRLEIGFGGGEHLVAEALAFANSGFIGCEPYVNGMAKILTQIEAHNIGNIRLFAGDATELLAWLPARSLERIDLIHPDPWPKRRHWKRRFVQDATIAAMARTLKPDGEFRCRQ